MINNVTLISKKQISYINKLVDEAKLKKIILKTRVNLSKLPSFSSKKANEIIKDLKQELGKKQTPVLNQTRKDKDLSNIPLKKEWIVDANYCTNSVLFLIPDFKNKRYLECQMPKGNRQVEYEDDDGEWKIKNTGKLIYNAKTKYYKQALEMNEYFICGVKLTWEKHFRWIPFDAKEVDIPKKERVKYSEFINFFEELVIEYHDILNLRKNQIMAKLLSRHKTKTALQNKEMLKVKIYNSELDFHSFNKPQDFNGYKADEAIDEVEFKKLWAQFEDG